jgi:PAS domain S-box-containing protein
MMDPESPQRQPADIPGDPATPVRDEAMQRTAAPTQQDSEEQFRRAVEEAPIPMIMHAEDGQVLQLSHSWTELTGYTLADIPTLDAWMNYAYGEGANAVRNHVHDLFAGNQRTLNVAFDIRTHTGELRHWSFSASSPGTLRDGRRFVVGMAQDITERTRAERALAEQARLLDLSNDAIIVRDVGNRIVYWNRGATELYGWSGEEAIGQNLHTLLQTEFEAPFEQLIAVLHEQDRMEDEVVQVTRDGRRLTLLCRWALDRDATGRPGAILTSYNDITERKRTERALRESERDFRAIFEGSSVGKAQVDTLTRRFLRVNAALCAITGYSEAELLARTAGDLTHPDDRERDHEQFVRLVQGKANYQLEKRYVRKDGRLVWVTVTGNVIQAANGQTVRIITVIQDITERKQAEEALRVSEAKYRTLFETMDEGFCILQLLFDAEQRPVDYRYIEVNPAFERHTGMRGALGRTIRELVPDIEGHWAESYGQVALTGEPAHLVDHARSLGRWFDVHAFRIGDPHERKVAVLFADITERKRREAHLTFLAEVGEEFARLSSAEDMIQAVGAKIGAYLQVTTCVFADVDEARGELTINDAWNSAHVPNLRRTFRITEYLTDEFARASRAGEMVVVRDTQTDPRTDARAYAALDVHTFVTVPFHRNGAWTHYLGVTDQSPRDWRGDELELIEELSNRIFPRLERARAEARLQELYAQEQAARAQAEEASRLKDEFLATVSHELRTPLTAFLGYAQLLQRGNRDAAYVARTVEKMVQSAKAQAALIEDLLDVSRIVSGRLHTEPEPVELLDVISAALDTVRPAVEAKGLQVQADLDPAASAVIGDPHRLQQVVWNLLSNASKFTPPGGQIAVRLVPAEGNAELHVSDTGQGIHPDFLSHVFERFRQADSSSHRAHGGLGLGLAIVRHLVELHGGTVEVRSAGVGQGATFTVRLPLAKASDPTAQMPSATASDAGSDEGQSPLRRLRVLVVDDQSAILELLTEILTSEGALVRSSTTAREALVLLRAWQPDVLVSDIAMPGEDGYWLIHQLRSLSPEAGGATPAVALTAYVRMEDRLRVLAAGFQQYLPKPVDAAELRDVIAHLVSQNPER